MLTLILSIVAATIAVYTVRRVIRQKLGISKATMHMKLNKAGWTAETHWVDKRTGQLHSIVTTTVPMDGVISVYDHYKIHYHSKEPSHGLFRIKRYHQDARNWFFNRMVAEYVRNIDLRKTILVQGKNTLMRPLLLVRRAAPQRTRKYPAVPLKRARA